MSNDTTFSGEQNGNLELPDLFSENQVRPRSVTNHQALPELICKAASRQTYYTIRFLVDRNRVLDAYRAYAYFRWVDDCLDECLSDPDERDAFVQRQQALISSCYSDKPLPAVRCEEQMLADLLRNDPSLESGLYAYIDHMMAVMIFDANRRGRVITQAALETYSLHLATAVTEAMHYFIGHAQHAPQCRERYCAVLGAHITHMLRDTCDDLSMGYYNIPSEFLRLHRIEPWDVTSDAYRLWTQCRVQLARSCFETGRRYLAGVENRRCRIAGYTYIARFESVLDAIERADYRLQPQTRSSKPLNTSFSVGWKAVCMSLRDFVHIPHAPQRGSS